MSVIDSEYHKEERSPMMNEIITAEEMAIAYEEDLKENKLKNLVISMICVSLSFIAFVLLLSL